MSADLGELPRFELACGEPGYPELLEATSEPPARLYGLGDPNALGAGLAMVGARKATPYGLRAARLFAGWAAGVGFTIVSGGAVGCDQAAHQAAVDADGRSVAVMGCGADIVYPRGAGDLLARIAKNGCIISEYPWGYPPTRWTFRARNRIIAGLSLAVLVLEAGLPSGTFSTADDALDAGREVLVVPGSIFAPECRGANRLLRQGATPITGIDELADTLGSIFRSEPSVCSTDVQDSDGCWSSDRVLSALRTNPGRPDDVAHSLGLDIVTTARRIGELESRGLVSRYPDGRYGVG